MQRKQFPQRSNNLCQFGVLYVLYPLAPSEAGNVMGQFASNVLPRSDGAIGVSKGGVPIPAGAIKTTIVRKVVKAGWF